MLRLNRYCHLVMFEPVAEALSATPSLTGVAVKPVGAPGAPTTVSAATTMVKVNVSLSVEAVLSSPSETV